MRTALRKMGNSTGMIIPKAMLTELEMEAGTSVELRIKDRAIVATPVAVDPRDLWAAELEAEGPEELTEDELAWIGTGVASDADWEW